MDAPDHLVFRMPHFHLPDLSNHFANTTKMVCPLKPNNRNNE